MKIAEGLEGTFSVPVDVANGRRQHRAAERPFPCDICKKSFHSSSNLNVHLCVHTRGYLYPCIVRKECFTYKSVLKKHLRVHNVEHQV